MPGQDTPNVQAGGAAAIYPWRVVMATAVDNTCEAAAGAATDPVIGITTGDNKSSTQHTDPDAHAEDLGDPVTLQPGSVKLVTAAGPVAAGALVRVIAAGLVDDTGTGIAVGISLQAAVAANDVIEILWHPGII